MSMSAERKIVKSNVKNLTREALRESLLRRLRHRCEDNIRIGPLYIYIYIYIFGVS